MLIKIQSLSLGFLNTISTTRCGTVDDSAKVKCATNKFVTHSRKILSTTSSNQNNTVLLQIVSLSLDISHERFSCGELHPGNFSFGGVRFLGCGNDEAGYHALALRAGHKEW